MFVPYVLEACGTFTEFKWDAFCMDWSYSYDVFNQPLNFDPMSCGQTPVTLPSGAADGVSFPRIFADEKRLLMSFAGIFVLQHCFRGWMRLRHTQSQLKRVMLLFDMLYY